jgi:tetratricopeptide (TPR) repeat protein
MARAGDVVAERFVLERIAGRGGWGEVWRARDRYDGAPVAVKVLSWAAPRGRERFAREGRLLAELGHPGIVRYVAHGETDGGVAYVAMEWLDGEDLAHRMTRAPLATTEAVDVARRVADALGAAHARGIVHRDVKPGNVLLVGGELARIKLLDFGIASLGSARTVTTTSGLLGTPQYMAPEQVRRAHEVDARADVFSLGCVLYRALTGRPPFAADNVAEQLTRLLLEDAPSLGEHMSDAPAALEELLGRMLAKEPAARPRDGAAVAAELAEVDLGTPRARLSLGSQELRLVSVVLVKWDGVVNDAAAAIAGRFGARLEALEGGIVVAVIDAAGEARDQAARAAGCALALRERWGAPVALATGPAVVGARVSIGEPIELAARLLRPGDGVWLDDATAALLDARFDVVRAGDPDAALLRGERDSDEPTRVLLGRASPCVGRERELATLVDLFEQSRTELVARAALVTAAPGVGKTRLRHELVSRLRARSAAFEVILGRGDAVSAGSAYGMLAQAMRATAGVVGGEPHEASARKLRDRVARHVPAAAVDRVARGLGELIDVSLSDEETSSLRAMRLDAVMRGDQMRAAIEDFVQAECSAHPVLFVLDDLHWGDRPTVDLVDRLLRNLQGSPLMVLALARPEVHEVFPRLWASRPLDEMRLGPLGRTSSHALVRAVLGADPTDDTVARVVERADGNALCLEELCHAVAEGRDDTLPGNVIATVQARLEALSGDARRVLRAASVFGHAFWAGGVRTLVGGEDVAHWLDAMADRDLVARRAPARFAGEVEYAFRHELVRDAAYGMLTETDRALGHKLAAAWLESVGETDALALADHAERGALHGRAASWYARAAGQALAGGDLAAAVDRAERGVACGATGALLGELRLVQGEALRWLGEWARAAPALGEAIDRLPHASASWFMAVREACRAAHVLGRADEMASLAHMALAPAGDEHAARERIVSCARVATELFMSGRVESSKPLLDVIEPHAADPDALVRATVLHALAMRALQGGDPGGVVELGQAALAAFEQAGVGRTVATVRANVAYGQAQLGLYEEAERSLRAATSEARRIGLPVVVAGAMQNLALVLACVGRLDEARECADDSIAEYARQGNAQWEGGTRIYLAVICSLAGDHAAAEQQARRALELLAFVEYMRCYALAVLADAVRAQGRPAEALPLAQEAMALLDQLGRVETAESRVRIAHAEALHAVGRAKDARAAVALARDRLLARADGIARPAWRASFLERVPENARVIALARAWLGA